MKTHTETTSARSILSSASGESLLLLAILSGRKQRAEIDHVLEKRAMGLGRAIKQTKRRAAAA